MSEAEVDAEWAALRARWPELFVLLDAVDLRLSPRVCSERLGLRSRAELERELRRRGLARFRVVRDAVYVARLRELVECSNSLASVASNRGDYATVLYRFVRTASGLSWNQLRSLSLLEVRRRAQWSSSLQAPIDSRRIASKQPPSSGESS